MDGWSWWWKSYGEGELCEKVEEIRRLSNRVMAVLLHYSKGCAEDDFSVCSTKWKMF